MTAPEKFLEPNAGRWAARVAALSLAEATELARRVRSAPLYAHAYSLHLNFRFGGYRPTDLLEFAAAQGLCGVKIHVEDGGEESLLAASGTARRGFGERARKLGLTVHIETSSTAEADMAQVIDIARATRATSVRCYPRYAARVSEIIARTIADLKLLSKLDPEGALLFTLEQHEDLTSAELVRVVEAVANPRLSLLFDFCNMINAHERPLEALRIQAPNITEVHIKDCHVLPDRSGWAQLGCISGTGEIPFADLLVELLLLGRNAPQVTAFALEEEVDYHAPAMRFPGEAADPFIPFRTASLTEADTAALPARLMREYQDAVSQITTIRNLLDQIQQTALAVAHPGEGATA